MRPICQRCNEKPCEVNYFNKKKNKAIYRTVCWKCEKRPWSLKKDSVCKMCGFKAEHSCQLDMDHIDGNHQNNEPGNLQTLCANCHRLKTYKNKDYIK